MWRCTVIERLNAFVDHCEARGVRVALAFAPFDAAQFSVETKMIHELEAILRAHYKGTILNTPADAAYPAAMLFDSPYHVTAKGKQLHMQRLMPKLQAFLEETEPNRATP